MRTPVTGEVHVHYWQLYVESNPDEPTPDLAEAYAGRQNGLCGAAVPGALELTELRPLPRGTGHGLAALVTLTDPSLASSGPHLISPPHVALPAVIAAADPDPLRAALDAERAAVSTYGEHYSALLTEIRAACATEEDPIAQR
jgi:hypothetical protein